MIFTQQSKSCLINKLNSLIEIAKEIDHFLDRVPVRQFYYAIRVQWCLQNTELVAVFED